LDEKHFKISGESISGALFDFGLYFFHNAHQAIKVGQGAYFYLPKLESHLEARLWATVFNWSAERLRVPKESIRATVLIETLWAAFEMEEIIYELREYSSGLNCGRWDYIFSVIKCMKARMWLPDRSQVTMAVPFMSSYVSLLISVCHRRGVHAMGGMAAHIPIKGDPEANEKAMETVLIDKKREAKAGHDGTWVAHPALIPLVKAVFDDHLKGAPNQLHRLGDMIVSRKDLLDFDCGEGAMITMKGIQANIRVALLYIASWLSGSGCVAIDNLMEDAATAEICRAQLWQWINCKCTVENELITVALIKRIIENTNLPHVEAKKILGELVSEGELADYITLRCYENL